jgi:hypothetical protein
MTVDVKLYVDNDSRVVVRPLLDGLTPITAATITVDLLDEFGDEVTPQQQLNELPETVPVTLEDGTVVEAYEYRTVIDHAVSLLPNHVYQVVITLTHPDGHDATWTEYPVARRRTGAE